jgi:hypothetical protein
MVGLPRRTDKDAPGRASGELDATEQHAQRAVRVSAFNGPLAAMDTPWQDAVIAPTELGM